MTTPKDNTSPRPWSRDTIGRVWDADGRAVNLDPTLGGSNNLDLSIRAVNAHDEDEALVREPGMALADLLNASEREDHPYDPERCEDCVHARAVDAITKTLGGK